MDRTCYRNRILSASSAAKIEVVNNLQDLPKHLNLCLNAPPQMNADGFDWSVLVPIFCKRTSVLEASQGLGKQSSIRARCQNSRLNTRDQRPSLSNHTLGDAVKAFSRAFAIADEITQKHALNKN
jgi:hypothetical protein